MARNFFENLPSTRTPLTAPRLNELLDGDESMGNIVVDSIKSKNLFNINGEVNVRGNDGVIVSKNTVSGNILTTNVNGSNENYVGQKLTNLNGKIFTFSAKIVSLGTGTAVRLGIYDNNTIAKETVSAEVGQYIKLTYTATSNNIVVSFGTSNGTGAQFTDIQVEVGNEKTDYAEFQGLGYVSGSNANGSYIKYDDGTLIQYNEYTVTDQKIDQQYGTTDLYTGTRTVIFPIPFVDAKYSASVGKFRWGTSSSWGTVGNNNSGSWMTIMVYDFYPRDTGTNCYVSWLAIGRWK